MGRWNKDYEYPLYFHAATLLYYNRKEEYMLAFQESNKLNLPGFFRATIFRISVLGQLGRIEEAESSISELLQVKPDFEEKTAYLISRFVKEEELVELVMDGLRKAGMELQPSELVAIRFICCI